MKKLLAGLLAGGMLFQTSALADTLSDFVDIASTQYTSATLDFNVDFELNKPMDFLGAIQNYSDDYRFYYYPGVDQADYQSIAESMMDSSANITTKAEVSDDYKKTAVEIQGDFNLPIQVNEYWKSNNDMTFGMWLDMDTSSVEDFKYEIILKSPLSRKYMHIDLVKMSPEITNAFVTQPLTQETIDELQKQSKILLTECLKDSAKIKKEGSKYTLTFDNAGLIDFFDKFVTGCMELSKQSMIKAGQEIPEGAFSLTSEATLVIEQLKQINFLGEKGFVIEVDTKGGMISGMNVLLDIDLNIYDILTLFEAEIPEFITKENSFISFTTTADYNYKDLNKTTVTLPEVNEENCHFFPEEEETIVYEEWDDMDYSDFYSDIEYFYNDTNGYCLKGLNSAPYLYFRGIMREYTSYDYSGFENYSWSGISETTCDIEWNDGIITVVNKGDKAKFNTLTLNTITDEAFIDGVKVDIKPSTHKHIVVKYGNTYISPELAKAMLGIEISDYYISFSSSGRALKADVYYSYPNPFYNPESDEL